MRIPDSRSHRVLDDGSAAMTPMIDVVFLLLIFFLCAAAGTVRESVIATTLSATGSVDSDAPPPPEADPWQVEVWLRITSTNPADGEGVVAVDMNGTPYSDLDKLEAQLAGLASVDATNPVILDVGDGVDWGVVIDLYDRCRRSGLESVNFATDAKRDSQRG
ncbi:MAG: biopolymer transporter ExbD [Planctomycetaceae bacterium]